LADSETALPSQFLRLSRELWSDSIPRIGMGWMFVPLPLHYDGRPPTTALRERDGAARTFKLDRENRMDLPVHVPAQGVTWFVIE